MGDILTAWMGVLTGGQRTEIRTFNLQVGEGIDAIPSYWTEAPRIALPLLTSTRIATRLMRVKPQPISLRTLVIQEPLLTLSIQ